MAIIPDEHPQQQTPRRPASRYDYAVILRNETDAYLLAEREHYGYRHGEYRQMVEKGAEFASETLAYVDEKLKDIDAEIEYRSNLRLRYPDDPRTPRWTPGKAQASSQLTQLKDDLRRVWSIDRLFEDVLGVHLERRGNGFVGLCPFHDDHNPSLRVDPKWQNFRCWSCGAQGDIFEAFGRYAGLDRFPARVEMLARVTPSMRGGGR